MTDILALFFDLLSIDSLLYKYTCMSLIYADYIFSQFDLQFSNCSHFGTFLSYALLSI